MNPWILLIVYTLLIIYARVGLTPLYSMLVLFADCWEKKLLTQAGLEKLNGDLHQPSRIRYVLISFSVRYLVSLAYWKVLISTVTLSIVVPQAMGSFLRNRIGDHTGEFLVISFGGLSAFNVLEFLWFLYFWVGSGGIFV